LIAIRAEEAGDAEAIRVLTTAAFAGAAHSSGREAAIVDELRAAGALSVSLVAEEAGVIVGHAAFSPVTIVGSPGNWMGLGPISVAPDRQHRGVGTALMRAGLDRIRGMAAAGCVLVGDPAYYGRFGFVSDGLLTCSDIPVRYVQRLVFNGPDPAGAIRFHPAFGVT